MFATKYCNEIAGIVSKSARQVTSDLTVYIRETDLAVRLVMKLREITETHFYSVNY